MAATGFARDPLNEVHLFEKRPSLGRKLLVAGSSGLNISHELSIDAFAAHYQGWSHSTWKQFLDGFGPKPWIQFIEKELGLETFLGTSQRYFVREMKASGLLKKWMSLLEAQGVKFHLKSELSNFDSNEKGVRLNFFGDQETHPFDRAAFFLGGGSWEEHEPTWLSLFREKGIGVRDFSASNVGYDVAWSPEFLKEAEGKPLKKIVFKSSIGEKVGELMVTRYGLEGTPIYFFGCEEEIDLDLKPDLTIAQILERCSDVKENLSPIRRVKQKLNLGEAALALLFHHTPEAVKSDLKKLAARVKRFPIRLLKPRPLQEAISSKGGVLLSELNENLELKKFKNIQCGGEMLDWDAPTGGFLIQAAVSQGAWASAH